MKNLFAIVCLSLLTLNTFGAADLNEMGEEANLLTTSIKYTKKEKVFEFRRDQIVVSCPHPQYSHAQDNPNLKVINIFNKNDLTFLIKGKTHMESFYICEEILGFIKALKSVEIYQSEPVIVNLLVDITKNELIEISADESSLRLR